jgi:transposase-like protein
MIKDQMDTSSVGDLSYFVNLEETRNLGRSPEHMLFERWCDESKANLVKAGTLPPAKRLLREIVKCCSRKEGFISADMPILEVAFRALLERGNEPMKILDLYHIVAEVWATPLNPRNITVEDFHRILGRDRYYGFQVASK